MKHKNLKVKNEEKQWVSKDNNEINKYGLGYES